MRPTIILLILLLAGSALAQEEVEAPCSAPEYSQFDFWVGTWLVRAEGRIAGHNIIRKINGNCTLVETYRAALNPFEGSSFTWYDEREQKWKQLWMDSGGTRLELAGEYEDDRMVLSGERFVDGRKVIDRIVWTADDDDTVRQHWEQSRDRGKSWNTIFDGRYTRVED